MTDINSGNDSFNNSIVFAKMGSIRVTSCNLLPGSKLMTVAPIKSKVHEVQIQGGAVHFNVNIYNIDTYTCEHKHNVHEKRNSSP